MLLSQFSLLLAVMVVAANVLTVVLLAGLVARRTPFGRTVRVWARPFALPLAAMATVAATLASLTLSEHYRLPPCQLCWYQRYVMYPLAVVLVGATFARFSKIRLVAIPAALVGFAVSAYHVALERFPSLESGACDLSNPCSVVWFQRFGFVTIPYGAGSVFLLTAALLAYAGSRRGEAEGEPDGDAPVEIEGSPAP